MIVNLKTLLDYAEKHNVAIGSFNYSDFDSLYAIVKAAEELNYPVILSHAPVHDKFIDIEIIAPIAIELAKKSHVPMCIHLDHGMDIDYIKNAMDLGFTSVMFDGSSLPYDENVRLTKIVVDYAKEKNISVEAELGRVMSNSEEERDEDSEIINLNPEAYYTIPEQAKQFIEETGIDCLAIAFGTVHGTYRSAPKLSLDVISSIRKITNGFPLVMHGGSGISEQDYLKVIDNGIRKINYYTYMQVAGYKSVKQLVESNQTKYYHDVFMTARESMYEDIKKTMRIFGRGIIK